MTEFMQKMLNRKLRTVSADRFAIDLNLPKSYPPIKARRVEEGGVRDRFFAAKAELPDEITVVHPFSPDGFSFPESKILFVSPNGNDSADGTASSPVRTLKEALARADGKCGMKIILDKGNYEVDSPLRITDSFSGTEETPLIFTSGTDEMPKISASLRLPPEKFSKPDSEDTQYLKPSAREKVLVCDLASMGVTEYGDIRLGGTELLINDTRQPLARYPNADEKLLDLGDRIIQDGITKDENGKRIPWAFGCDDERCYTWKKTDDIFIYGALCYEWIHDYTGVGSFDKANKVIYGSPERPYQCKVQARGRNDFCFVNVFEELDAPGEWYIDRKKGLLWLYPPENTDFASADIRLITDKRDIFILNNVSNVIFDRLDIGRCAGSVFEVQDCNQVLIQHCKITGTCPYERHDSAVIIAEGRHNGVIASTFSHFINRAIRMRGGDRLHLKPAGNFIQNNMFIEPHCRFGLTIDSGIGNVVSHNYVCDTTMVSEFNNECVTEYNVFEHGDHETSDSGMIYVGGCELSAAGNHFRYNYLFDFAKVDYGIYFDDLARGMYAYGNIVVGNGSTGYLQWDSGGRTYNTHNGSEHCFYNNISIDAGYFAFGGDITYWLFDENWNGLYPCIRDTSRRMNSPEFIARNPAYKELSEYIETYEKEKNEPGYVVKSGKAEQRLRTPWCNNYENNVIVRAARAFKLDNGEATATSLDTNYITDSDPGFVDFENRDYRIRSDAPLFDKIPDFVPPPFEKMGLTDDFAD